MLKIKLHSKLIQGFSQDESSELDEGKREDDAKKAFPDKGDLIAYFTDPSRSVDGNKYLLWMVKHTDESRLFKFNKDYKVFKLL